VQSGVASPKSGLTSPKNGLKSPPSAESPIWRGFSPCVRVNEVCRIREKPTFISMKQINENCVYCLLWANARTRVKVIWSTILVGSVLLQRTFLFIEIEAKHLATGLILAFLLAFFRRLHIRDASDIITSVVDGLLEARAFGRARPKIIAGVCPAIHNVLQIANFGSRAVAESGAKRVLRAQLLAVFDNSDVLKGGHIVAEVVHGPLEAVVSADHGCELVADSVAGKGEAAVARFGVASLRGGDVGVTEAVDDMLTALLAFQFGWQGHHTLQILPYQSIRVVQRTSSVTLLVIWRLCKNKLIPVEQKEFSLMFFKKTLFVQAARPSVEASSSLTTPPM